MKLGGYKIIDCAGVSINTGASGVINGIYDAIEATNARVVISGLVVDSKELDDFTALFEVVGTTYVAVIGTLKITVSENNTVAIARVANVPALSATVETSTTYLLEGTVTPAGAVSYAWVVKA